MKMETTTAATLSKNVPIKAISWVWKYFKISNEDASSAICNICESKLSRGAKDKTCKSFTTSNMLRHINTKHADIAKEESELLLKEKRKNLEKTPTDVRKRRKTDPGCSAASQPTLFETFEKKKLWDINDQRSKIIHSYIAEMIAVDIQPFSIVEDLGFQRLLHHLCPNYSIPSRKYIKEFVFQNMYEKVKCDIQNELNVASAISFTSDGWTTDNGNCSFLSLTAHWLNDDFQQKTAVVRVRPLNESHTAKNISEAIQSCLNDFNISPQKVHLIARDNAANMVAGIREAKYEGLPCFLHTLQLVLNDAVFTQQYVKNIEITAKLMVSHFNHSPSSFANYRKYQIQFDVPQNRFIQDIVTRWNSQYFMFERILEQKRALIPFLCDNPKIKSLENNEWHLIEKLVKFLKIFNDVTNILSRREAIASSIIPTIEALNNFIHQAEESKFFSGLGTTIFYTKKSANERFEKYVKDKNLILATFLDPRYKDVLLIGDNFNEVEDLKEKILTWFIQDIINLESCKSTSLGDNDPDLVDPTDSSPSESDGGAESALADTEAEKFDVDFFACLDNALKNKNTTTINEIIVHETNEKSDNYNREIRNEVSVYLNQAIVGNQECPLIWWRKNKRSFKYLTILARKYLSCPPSSIESERLFSSGGQIYSPRRNRLTPVTGEMLMFQHYNLPIIGFKY